MYKTVKGNRCSHTRTGLHFCRQHEKSSEKAALAFSRWLRKSAWHRTAAESLDKWLLQQAVARSLEDEAAYHKRAREAQAILHDRLREKNKRVVETEALGDCFFVALQQTAGLATTPRQLRLDICEYIWEHKDTFAPSFPNGEEGLRQHVERMARCGVWATGYEVTAAAMMLNRPIHLITDAAEEFGSTLIAQPRDCVHASTWGTTVYLGHYLDWHFEGTAMVEMPPA